MIAITTSFTLGKQERLKSRKQIDKLFRDGRRFGVFPFRIYYVYDDRNGDSPVSFPVQFGAGVSARNFKKAVDRNRIKRLTRECYRLQKQALYDKMATRKGQLSLFFIFTGKELPDYQTLYGKMALSLGQLIKEL